MGNTGKGADINGYRPGRRPIFTEGQINVEPIPTEKLYEGPILKHGFIDEDELEKADREKAAERIST